MPLNIVVGLVALFVALVLYSIASWGAFRAKSITKWQVILLWVGFAFDTLATAMMAIQARGLDLAPLSHMLHTILAFVAMAGMLVAAIMSGRALAGSDTGKAGVARWILAPWAFWVILFLWAMISRAPARVG